VAGIIGTPGRLQSVQAAAFARNPRPTSSECATLPHFSVSSAINLLKSAGDKGIGSPPSSVSFPLIAESASISLLSLLMISSGVWLGAPRQFRPLPHSLRRRSHDLISCLDIRFHLRYVGANACENFKHLRLLIGRQIDEFAAVI
jgi:hypothetical protein